MILVLDVGNTQTHVGLFTRGRLRATWRLSTDPRRTVDEYVLQVRGILDDQTSLEGAAISSVVPRVAPVLARAIEKASHITPMILDDSTEMGLRDDFAHPADVGMDRLALEEIGHPCRVIATGEGADRFAESMPFVEAFEPDLTLYALRRI